MCAKLTLHFKTRFVCHDLANWDGDSEFLGRRSYIGVSLTYEAEEICLPY